MMIQLENRTWERTPTTTTTTLLYDTTYQRVQYSTEYVQSVHKPSKQEAGKLFFMCRPLGIIGVLLRQPFRDVDRRREGAGALGTPTTAERSISSPSEGGSLVGGHVQTHAIPVGQPFF